MPTPNRKQYPNKNIRHNPHRQLITIHRDSSIPKQPKQRPRIRPRDSREVHEGRKPTVAPVCGVEVDKVENEEDLGAPEVVAGPEEDPDEEGEVVEDKVGGDVGGGGY